MNKRKMINPEKGRWITEEERNTTENKSGRNEKEKILKWKMEIRTKKIQIGKREK